VDFNKNADKINDCYPGVSYNQVIDVENTLAVPAELFTVDQFKNEYGKIDTTVENNLISSLIIVSRQMCEQYTGINFIARTVTATINNNNGGTYLPYGPVGAIASVTDIDGNTIVTDNYKTLGNQFKKVLWPLQELIITYTGGYASGQCPEEFVNAVKAQTLFLFENRGDSTVSMSPVATLILNPLRRT
jgi:uncharacterized phiE125 gp8 family phage protein